MLYPPGVAVDSAGNFHIADHGNNRIRKVWSGTGIITAVSGNGTGRYSGDNGAATATSLYGPTGVAVEARGTFISPISTITVSGWYAGSGIITTVAVKGTEGYSGDNGTATGAGLNNPTESETGSTWIRKYGTGSAYIDSAYGGLYYTSDLTYYNSGIPPSADYSVIATIHAFSVVRQTNQGVSGRLNTKINSRYFTVFSQGLGWGSYAADGHGYETRIAPFYWLTRLTAGHDYRLELRMVGSTISLYVDNILAASGTNTLYSAGGHAGVETAGAGPGVAFEMIDFKVASPGS